MARSCTTVALLFGIVLLCGASIDVPHAGAPRTETMTPPIDPHRGEAWRAERATAHDTSDLASRCPEPD